MTRKSSRTSKAKPDKLAKANQTSSVALTERQLEDATGGVTLIDQKLGLDGSSKDASY